MFEVFFICFEVTIFFALLRFIIWYYTSVALWILFSPDYLVVVIGAGAFTVDHIDWLTSSLAGQIAWGIMAMVVAWAVYFTFNSALYEASKRIYRIVSFLLIVGCSLYIMFSLVLRLIEKVGPQLANDSATNHMVYVCIAVVIALVAWIRRQGLMSRLDADDKLTISRNRS